VIGGALAGLLAADELRGLVAVAARLRATGGDASGTAIGARVGRGHDLHGLDPFRPGDDPRAIDWRARQRTGALWVRRHHVEGERAIAVLIDDSASMTRARRQLARRIAAGLAVVAGAAALPIAVAGLGAAATRGRRPVRLGPGEVAARLAPLVAAGVRSPDPSSADTPGPDALDVALARAARWAQADDRIALVSDLADPAPVEALAGAAARLGRRAGQVVTVQLIDARDGALPADVDRLRSAERGATRAIDHAAARGFAARVAAWHRELAGAFARVGAPLVVVDVAAPPPLAALVAQVVAAWR